MPNLIAAEFAKLFSTRLWLWLLLASMGLVALYAGLNIAFADDPDNVTLPLNTPAGQQTLFAVAAGARPLIAVLGAIAITSEFRHKTATATFLATPHRGQIVIAKLITYGAVGLAYAVACIATVIAISLPWLASKNIDVTMTGNGIPTTLAGVVAAYAIFALIGVAVGALIREQVAAVVGLLIYLFVIEPIVTNIPALSSWTPYLPGSAGAALTNVTITNQDFLAPWQGALVLIGYSTLLAIAGTRLAVRRDVT